MSGESQRTSEEGSAVERGTRSLPLDRFNAFSDGVFAIAITLLAIEIAVPPEGVPLLTALREQWPDFLGYYISFAFIGGIWITHSGVTKFMKLGDSAAYALNLVLLLFVGLLPFTTSLMVTRLRGEDAGLATLLYGVDVLLASLVMSLLILYLGARARPARGRPRRGHLAARGPAALGLDRLERRGDRRGRRRPAGRRRPLSRGEHLAADHPAARHAPAPATTARGVDAALSICGHGAAALFGRRRATSQACTGATATRRARTIARIAAVSR